MTTPEVQQLIGGLFACNCTPWPDGDGAVSFAAPAEKTYPLSFYAEMPGTDFNGRPLHKEVVFTQSSPLSPWLVSYISDFVGPTPVLGSSVNVGAPLAAVPHNPAQLPAEVAAFYQQLDQSGGIPTWPPGFAEDGITTSRVQGSLLDDAVDAANHFSDLFSHHIDSMSAVYPLDNSKGDTVCFAMTVTERRTPARGRNIEQPTDQSAWGPLLAPGLYGSLTETSVADDCLAETVDGVFRESSDMVAAVSITGTPAAPGTTPQLYHSSADVTVPSTTTTTTPPLTTPKVADVWGQAIDGQSAVVNVDPATNQVTIDSNQLDVTYSGCRSFNVSGLELGDFVKTQVDNSVPCLSRATILNPPQPPVCHRPALTVRSTPSGRATEPEHTRSYSRRRVRRRLTSRSLPFGGASSPPSWGRTDQRSHLHKLHQARVSKSHSPAAGKVPGCKVSQSSPDHLTLRQRPELFRR